MTKRIPFHIVYATSEDSSYPACELNCQGPGSRGWRSTGPPPHELLLRLTCVAKVHKLQLLAHHQLIPEWVEVLVWGGLSEDAGTPCGAVYASVGRVALAQPAHQARTRELRSAALPEPTLARFVKLRLSGPHPPAANTDQVALMAINVLGTEIEDQIIAVNNVETYSPFDDLSFVMYVDGDIADMIRRLDERKKRAVAEERFEYARRLKSASTALTSAGVRIGRWRLRKRTAAVRDDFEVARVMRDRISDALDGIRGDEDLGRLFEDDDQPNPLNDTSMPEDYDLSQYLSPSVMTGTLSLDIPSPVPPIQARGDHHHEDMEKDSLDGEDQVDDENEVFEMPIQKITEVYQEVRKDIREDRKEIREERVETQKFDLHLQSSIDDVELRRGTDSPRRSITPNSANGGVLVKRRHKSAGPRTTFEAYEERLLPALRHSQTNEYLHDRVEVGSATSSAGSHQRPVHKMTEKERKQAALPILIFGQALVEKFYSKNYLDKEEGLTTLRTILRSPSDGAKTSPNKTARAATMLLQKSLRDKVHSVYSLANELVIVLFSEFMPQRVCAAEVSRSVQRVVPELVKWSGDPAPRVAAAAVHCLLSLHDCDHVRNTHIISQQLSRPVTASMHPRLALSSLQMLEQLILTHGFCTDKNSGLTVRRVAECGAGGAAHAAGSVRAAAERILLLAYRRSPRLVRAQLPPDDNVTRRNLMYRHLFHQFDKIDTEIKVNKCTGGGGTNSTTSVPPRLVRAQLPPDDNVTRRNLMYRHLFPQFDKIDTEKLLSQAQAEDPNEDKTESILDTASISQSVKSGASSLMNSSYGMTSSYSMKSLASSVSGETLAPSSLSGSYSAKSKSSLKSSARKYSSPGRVKDMSIGFNKLRLDSAVSPKHSPKTPNSGEKVHFLDQKQEVVLRKTNRNADKRHSFHFDQNPSKPQLRPRPVTVYEPSPNRESPLNSPRIPKNDLRSLNSLTIESPQRTEAESSNLDSPKSKVFSGNREENQMDESGYYSPIDNGKKRLGKGISERELDQNFDSFEGGGDVSSDGTPEPVCNTSCSWCGVKVRPNGLDSHYYKRCVVLANCAACDTTVEARTLHSHLLKDCSMSINKWKQCKRCSVALKMDEEGYHPNCVPLSMDEWKCPYCYTNILARDLPWQRHLMQCSRNPRRNLHY